MQHSVIVLLVALTVVLVSAQQSTHHAWYTWKRIHNKQYAHAQEESERRQKWEHQVADLQAHNLRHQLGLETYSLGLNQFSDMDWDELSRNYLTGLIVPKDVGKEVVSTSLVDPIPESLDWRVQGYVTPVRNQGGCGSCWAFSTVGALEGAYKTETGKLYSLSEQQLVDCSRTHGCKGGWPLAAYNYVKEHGIMNLTDYPYAGREQPCAAKEDKAVLKTDTWWVGKRGDEQSMKELVATHGPASVCITVQRDFFRYKSGVYNPQSCPGGVNHAVLAVGYGTENGVPYWIVKNSWGPRWGEGGYIKMARDKNNLCQIASYANVPHVVPVP